MTEQFWAKIGRPMPSKECDFYFSAAQREASNYVSDPFSIRQRYMPREPWLAILDTGDIVEYTEKRSVNWRKFSKKKDAHSKSYKDSVYLGTGVVYDEAIILEVIENLVK